MLLLTFGFRPFFLLPGIFGVLSIGLWAIYPAWLVLPLAGISDAQWHAHEMIYGYSAAVIAGFLLTTARDWTGIQTTSGPTLIGAGLAALWLLARVSLSGGLLLVAAVFDLLFFAALCGAIAGPLMRSRQWQQAAILVALVSLLVFNGVFYLGALALLERGVHWGLYGGLYLLVGLIMIIGRRLLLFFSAAIERGFADAEPVRAKTLSLDIASGVLFLVFFISELALDSAALSAWTALALFAVNAARLLGFAQRDIGIWRKPLLWSLYLSLWCIAIGFALFASARLTGLGTSFAAIHAFAYGAIGAVTLAMMAHVSLGATRVVLKNREEQWNLGRLISMPPPAIGVSCGILLIGALICVAFPLLLPQYEPLWIIVSQGLWILAVVIVMTVFIIPKAQLPKPKLKVGFADYPLGIPANERGYHFRRLLSIKYDVEISENPDLLFCSVFTEENNYEHLNYDCMKCLISEEHPNRSHDLWDFSFSGLPGDAANFHYFVFGFGYQFWQWAYGKQSIYDILKAHPKERFCNFFQRYLVSAIRGTFTHKLMKYKHVDCPGKIFNNMPYQDDPKLDRDNNKLAFLKHYRFTICFEHTSHPYFMGEKLPQALMAGSIPIYWGMTRIGEYFNPARIINCHEYEDLNAVIEHIKAIEESPALYRQYTEQPPVLPDSKLFEMKPEAIFNRLDRIVEHIKCGTPPPFSQTVSGRKRLRDARLKICAATSSHLEETKA